MKIIILASGSINSSLTARAVSLGRSLVKRGYEVSLIAPSADKYNDFVRDKRKELDGIHIVHPYQFTSRNELLNFLPYIPLALLSVFFMKSDIIQIYKPTPITVVGLAARMRRRKIILDMDDLGSQVMKRVGRPSWVVKLVNQCERIVARNADGIMVVSSFLLTYYKQSYPAKPAAWVSNGITALPTLTPLENGHPQIIFLGTLEDTSVLEPLLRAIPAIVQSSKTALPILTVIGDGAARRRLEELTRQLGATKAVVFAGAIEHEHLPQFLRAGDLGYCCVPDEKTYRAASSQKIFDYMAAGVVPVVNCVGDLPYYIEDGEAGYLVRDDLTTVISQALRDKVGRVRRSKQARARAASNFTWYTLSGRAVDLYHAVLAKERVA